MSNPKHHHKLKHCKSVSKHDYLEGKMTSETKVSCQSAGLLAAPRRFPELLRLRETLDQFAQRLLQYEILFELNTRFEDVFDVADSHKLLLCQLYYYGIEDGPDYTQLADFVRGFDDE